MKTGSENPNIDWKNFLKITFESILTFYLATFSLTMFLSHLPEEWILPTISLVILYLFIVFILAKRILQKFSLAEIMLIIPIAPLLALIIFVTLIPILEIFK